MPLIIEHVAVLQSAVGQRAGQPVQFFGRDLASVMLKEAFNATPGQPEDQAVEIPHIGHQRPTLHGLRHQRVEGGAQDRRGGRVHHHQRKIIRICRVAAG